MKIKNALLLSIIVSLGSSFAHAAPKKPAPKKSQATASAKKKLTIGDVLKRAQEDSRGGKLQQAQKAAQAVPDSKITFQQSQNSNVNLNSVKPPRSTEILSQNTPRSGNEAEYERTLDQQIQELYKLTQKFAKNPARGELWLRLAELYVEKASLVDFRKQDIYDRQLKDFLDGKTKVKPTIDTAEAKQYNKKAIQLYEWFLRDYPNDEKQSQALFFLGYNYYELGDSAQGTKYYNELTRKFPKSQYVIEGYFALGEYYFEKEKWADAYKEYANIIKKPKHRLNTFAMYKSAWCLFRIGKVEDAIKYMDYIIKNKGASAGNEGANSKNVNKNRLEIEAARDIVVFFADTGDPQRAIDYFSANVTPAAKLSALEKLGYFYADKGNREGSATIFHHLIAESPNSKKAFEYQYQIVQNYFYAKNSPQFKEELYRWINDYSNKSAWYAANQSDKAFVDNSYKLREQTLRNYILQQHQTAQNSRAAFSQKSALEGYQMYFQEFPDSPQVADMRFFYGELLYDMARYDEASAQYSWVVENAPKNKFAAKAGQNIILAAERALPKDEELQKRVGDSIEPIALDPKVERYIKAANLYLVKFPNTERDAEIRFKTGRLYYQTNHFTEAEVIFKEIIQKHAKTKYAEYSANLLLDMYNLKKDYEGLSKMGNELLANSAISSSKAGNDIRGVLEKANFKKAQDLEVEKNYAKSAEQYDLFVKQNPNSDLASMAIFNAGVNYERSGETLKASQNYQKIVASSDKKMESLKPKAKKLLAKLYQDAGRLEDSARLFSELAAENPKDALATNYYYNAAIMYDTLGDNTKALKNYAEFLKVNKNSKDKADAIRAQAELYAKSNSRSLAVERYSEYVNIVPDSGDKVAALDYLMRNDRKPKDEIEKYRNRIVAMHRRLSGDEKAKAAPFVAKIKYAEVQKTYNEFVQIKIPANAAKQKAAVDKKLEFITKLSAELTEIIKLDSAQEIIQSIVMLGDANEHMGNSILNTPLPTDLGEEQRKIYQTKIGEIADPFIKKSVESYKLAVERAHDLAVYNDAYRSAYSKLSVKDPETYYNKGEMTFDSRLMNWLGE
jgi:cellulose synthase operon protein C